MNYALGALYYLCNASNKEEILKAEVVDVIKRYAAAEVVSVSFSNLAKAFLDNSIVWGGVFEPWISPLETPEGDNFYVLFKSKRT